MTPPFEHHGDQTGDQTGFGGRAELPGWVSGVVAEAEAVVGRLAELCVVGLSPSELAGVLGALEGVFRRVDVVKAELAGRIDRGGLHRADGFRTAAAMLGHVGKLSDRSAKQRVGIARAMVVLAEVAAAYRAGELSTDQMAVLARLARNPRIAGSLVEVQGYLVEAARRLDARDFATFVSQLQRLLDD